MVISPEFSSDACMVFAAGPIGAAFAVFRSNCETTRGGARAAAVSPRRAAHRSGHAFGVFFSNCDVGGE